MLHKVLRTVDRVNRWFGTIAGFLPVFLAFVVVADVVLRYFFKRPTEWGFEMSSFLMLGAVFLGGGFTFLEGGHVKVDVLYNRLSVRKRAITDAITHLFALAFAAVVAWQGVMASYGSLLEGTRTSSSWGPELWPVQMVIALGAIVLGLQILVKMVRDWLTIAGKSTDAEEERGFTASNLQ